MIEIPDMEDARSNNPEANIVTGTFASILLAGALVVLGILIPPRWKLFGIYPLVTPPWVRTFMSEWAYSIKKAEDELGYRPMPFKDAMRITYDWLLEQRT